jgi:hypothetical protein
MLPRMTVSLLAVKAYLLFGIVLSPIESAAQTTSPPYPGFASLNLMIQYPGKSSIVFKIYNDDAFLNQRSLMGNVKTNEIIYLGRSERDNMENRELICQISSHPCSFADLYVRSGCAK